MKVNRFELVKKLEQLLPAVGFNAMLPEFQRFRISESIATATDGAMRISTVLPVDFGFSCSVVAQEFYHLLSSLTDEEIDISLDKEEGNVLIKSKKVKAKFASAPYKTLKDVELCGTAWNAENFPGGFDTFVKKLLFCQTGVSKDETAGVWCGVIVEGDQIVTSDKYRICRSKTAKIFDSAQAFSIPVKFIDLLVKYTDKIDLISLADQERKLCMVLKDGTILCTTLFSGGYTDVRPFFPGPDAISEKILITPEILEAVSRHAVFLKDLNTVDRDITVSFEGKECIIKSELPQVGELTETVPVGGEHDCYKFVFFINPGYFDDANRKMGVNQNDKKEQVLRYFTDAGYVIFVSGEDEYLINTRG